MIHFITSMAFFKANNNLHRPPKLDGRNLNKSFYTGNLRNKKLTILSGKIDIFKW